MVFILIRRERVSCAKCGASDPAIYKGQQCLICGSTIDAANGHRKGVGTMVFEKHRAEETKGQRYKAQIAALQSERDELSAALAALTHQDVGNMSDYEWYVELAAEGMAERDNHPMPRSVTTPEAFYEVMPGAALDAIDLRTLLNRMTRAERAPESRFARFHAG